MTPERNHRQPSMELSEAFAWVLCRGEPHWLRSHVTRSDNNLTVLKNLWTSPPSATMLYESSEPGKFPLVHECIASHIHFDYLHWAKRWMIDELPEVDFVSLTIQRTWKLEVPNFSKLICWSLCLRHMNCAKYDEQAMYSPDAVSFYVICSWVVEFNSTLCALCQNWINWVKWCRIVNVKRLIFLT